MMKLAVGELVHGYRICRFLGRGGFTSVYQAVEEDTGAKVALKVGHASGGGRQVTRLLEVTARRSEEGAYVWQRLMQSGAVVMNGTDAPVEDLSPIANYYSTVSRRPAGQEVFFPDQRMSRMEALRSYTINAAYGAFEEDLKGSLEVGKLADITVLSQDILTIDEDMILATEIEFTIVGGEVVHSGGR